MFVGVYCTFVGPFLYFLLELHHFCRKPQVSIVMHWEFSTQDVELFLSICWYPLVPDLQHAGRGNFWQGHWEGG